jgi:subtilisin-like proprotein convertase family protein
VVKLTENEKSVALAEHDLNMRFSAYLQIPTDPSYSSQWHLHHRVEHNEYDQRSSVRGEEAWQLLDSFGSAEVVVGVTDDGCKLDHHDFDSPNKFAGWGYFEGFRLFKKGEPDSDPNKMHKAGANHGTSCAGVIAAETDGEMTVGVAPGCRLLPIKWESSGPSLFISDSKLLIALDYIADKVDVLSNSWGSSPVSNWSNDVLERIEELAQTGGRRGKGIVFLWAAGNENCPIAHTSDVNVPYTNGWELQSNGTWRWAGVLTARQFEHNLVGVPGVMHVAALASTAQRSHYSNHGTGIDVCAPTSNSHAYFRMPVDGLGITTTTGSGSQVTDSFGGTTSATPLTAGVAALVISANSQLTSLQVISLLKQTASKDLVMTDYPRTPPAAFDPEPTWDVSPVPPFSVGDFTDQGHADGTWSPWFGHGRVDAVEAIRRARQATEGPKTRVRVEQVANLTIPDADPSGIVSTLFIQENGRIQNLKVDLDIRHTYIGDLIVRLADPDGGRIDLHRRTGRSSDDLITTFDESSTPDLNNLNGHEIRGAWALEVSDYARLDQGQLLRWAIEAEVVTDGTIRVESTPGRIIPDNDPSGITDVINISEERTISEISIEVDITHTWIGDLKIDLRGPNNIAVTLHSREGREADDIQQVYSIANEPALSNFVGQRANGDWLLSVSDNQSRDIGKLNRWALVIR